MQAPVIDISHLRTWIGKIEEAEDLTALRHARLMAATIDRPGAPLQPGDALPPLWHWLYFLEGLPPAQLGRDGHPARGGFLPPVPLPNRMWAGGRVDFLAPLPLGATMRKRSQVIKVDHKSGRSGDLVFVTVLHEVLAGETLAVREEHDIVYKSAAAPGQAAAAPATALAGAPLPCDHAQAWTPDTTQLFRYSALTFNGHRIHYDLAYAREVEGYDHLVVHGPLTATLLAGLGQQVAGQPLKRFVYRGLKAFTLGQTVQLKAARQADGSLQLWSQLPDGAISMQAQAWTA